MGNATVAWTVWRRGALLMAKANPATTLNPFRFEFDAPPEHIVRPPLDTTFGELFVAAVTAKSKELTLVRFHSSHDALEITPGRQVGRLRLPAPPVATRAILQPASVGNGISVLLVAQSEAGLELHHVQASGTVQPPRTDRIALVDSTPLPGLSALPQSEPGLWIDSEGRLNAALLAASLENPRQAVLVRLRYRPDGKPGAPARVTPLVTLPQAPVAAAVRYSIEPSRSGELAWAILLEDGRLLHRSNPRVPMMPRWPPAVPLELFITQATRILTVDPHLGPAFEVLR
jgi:hypothetical protein